MATLRFRSPGSSRFDFDDWVQAPALVAHLLGAKGTTNTMAAVRVFLAAQKIDMHTAEVGDQGGTIRFTGSAWHPVSDHMRWKLGVSGGADQSFRPFLGGV